MQQYCKIKRLQYRRQASYICKATFRYGGIPLFVQINMLLSLQICIFNVPSTLLLLLLSQVSWSLSWLLLGKGRAHPGQFASLSQSTHSLIPPRLTPGDTSSNHSIYEAACFWSLGVGWSVWRKPHACTGKHAHSQD